MLVILDNRNQPRPPFPLVQDPINLGNQVAIPATGDKTPFTSQSNQNVFLVVMKIMKWRKLNQSGFHPNIYNFSNFLIKSPKKKQEYFSLSRSVGTGQVRFDKFSFVSCYLWVRIECKSNVFKHYVSSDPDYLFIHPKRKLRTLTMMYDGDAVEKM